MLFHRLPDRGRYRTPEDLRSWFYEVAVKSPPPTAGGVEFKIAPMMMESRPPKDSLGIHFFFQPPWMRNQADRLRCLTQGKNNQLRRKKTFNKSKRQPYLRSSV